MTNNTMLIQRNAKLSMDDSHQANNGKKIVFDSPDKCKQSEFIVTEEFIDEDYNRPDIPDWYRNEVMTLINNNNNKELNKYEETLNKEENNELNQNDEYDLNVKKKPFRAAIVWRNVLIMSFLHIAGIYGWYSNIRYGKWQSIIWAYMVSVTGGIGILAGAHRLWTHRSYKAHWFVRLLLMFGQTLALQNDIYEWARDHRVHHKYSETDADPHNSRRGFFFAHMGWLLCRKHPEVKSKGSQIDMSDVWADPIVRFQRRFYIPLVLLIWGIIPVMIPVYLWNEVLSIAITGNFFRYIMSLHHAWLVNSAAHISGFRFYERSIQPVENHLVTYLTLGEGYHNYHHTFPWDYSASEHGWRFNFNPATMFIDFYAMLGLVYDRRIVSRKVIEQRVTRTGDTSLMPKHLDEKRKPFSAVIDSFTGFAVSAWMVWFTLFLTYFFHI